MRISRVLSRSTEPTVFHLTGGIGNQLFGYAAGKAFSKTNNRDVLFDLSDVGKGFTKHKSSILSLNLELKISPSKSLGHQFLTRIINKVNRILKKLIRKNLSSGGGYLSYEIGYDPKLFEIGSVRNVRGYFQSWRYFELVSENFLNSNTIVRHPSDWYVSTCAIAETSRPIFIHVRRGDYKQLSDSYGLLNADYYFAAIKIVRKFLPDNPIWVVSDDIPEAKNLLASILPANTNWIDPPDSADPVESLALMSRGAGNIIANSTFSWWSAILNEKSVVTVAPEKWFKGMRDPKDLYPPHWQLVQSSWQD